MELDAELLAASGAQRDLEQVVGDAALTAVLAEHGYPVSAAILAFDRAYGGWGIPEDGDPDVLTIIGAYHCVASDWHVHPTGDIDGVVLVPVAYTPNDGILFLDADGATYYQDTIEDPQAVALDQSIPAALTELIKMFM